MRFLYDSFNVQNLVWRAVDVAAAGAAASGAAAPGDSGGDSPADLLLNSVDDLLASAAPVNDDFLEPPSPSPDLPKFYGRHIPSPQSRHPLTSRQRGSERTTPPH